MVIQASDDNWYPLSEADIAHKTDAVIWWNQTGRALGAKSEEVRKWMLDSNNYYLDHFSINRSAGAKLRLVYFFSYKIN
ncbi:GH-E family nuclease [Hafnia paralvei]|uniref:GH-E family nuclease n=1 Tax=Hafnia paralvei TaxID=546367 RepID=UPI001CB88FC0|nr:GH-E family nuclease [Hafnia paralvei]